MWTVIRLISAVFLLCTSTAWGAPEIRQERISLDSVSSVVVKGTIKGRQTVDYKVIARAGETLTVAFRPGNLSAYFNVLPPGSEEAIFIGSSAGNDFSGRLPIDGEYTIRVYLMRNAARRNEKAKYSLAVRRSGAAEASSPAMVPFDRTLELQGIRFRVTSLNSGSINALTITPTGLEIDNSPLIRTIEGTVTGAEAADLNADGSPEIYVYVASAGSGSYGTLAAFSTNRRKSLSDIYLPSLADDRKLSTGYRGHDEFAVLEGRLGRRFPLYRDGDVNAQATGGMRQIQYKLVPGEAGWHLTVDKVLEF